MGASFLGFVDYRLDFPCSLSVDCDDNNDETEDICVSGECQFYENFSMAPSTSMQPSSQPSSSMQPSSFPSDKPSNQPSISQQPSVAPSQFPTSTATKKANI